MVLNKKKKVIIVVVIAVFIVLLVTAFYEGLAVTKYSVETDKVKEPIRIVLLTDLHSCFYGKNQEDLLAKIDEQHPDIVLMVGDIADDVTPIDGTVALLKGLADRYLCFYVTGNHEFWSGEVETIKNVFREYNVRVLEGESVRVGIKGQSINICGVDDPDVGERIFQRQIEKAFESIDEDLYTILLLHRPERFEAVSENSCDLILSGHAHGGQWRIPFILDGLYAPDQGFFPKYTSGIYTMNETNMVVGRGMHRAQRVPRIYNPPEVVVIDIVPQQR